MTDAVKEAIVAEFLRAFLELPEDVKEKILREVIKAMSPHFTE